MSRWLFRAIAPLIVLFGLIAPAHADTDAVARGLAIKLSGAAANSAAAAQATLAATNALVNSLAGQALPANTVLPSFTGTRTVGSTLTGLTGTWSGSPTFACAWQRNGTAISGATTCASYTLVTADGGTTITLKVTATNSYGPIVAVSAGLLVDPASTALTFSNMLSTYHTGVNMAGHEFISGGFPGKCGGGPFPLTADHIAYYANAGAKVIRMPFSWEELQPQVYGPLGQVIPVFSTCTNFPNTVAEMHASLALADAAGMKVMLDNHGYGGRSLQDPNTLVWTSTGGTGRNGIYAIGSTQVPCAAFADFWGKMATEFKADAGVLGWDLMNEPVSVPNNAAGLTVCYQAAINAIRATGDTHIIFIEPLGYAIAEAVATNNPTGTIETLTDTASNLVFEGHEYEDNNRTGTYASTEAVAPIASQSLDLMQTRIAPFVSWCSSFSLHCMIGEFGVPNENNWEEIERRGYVYMRANNLPRTRWADWPAANDNILNPRDPTGATVRRGMVQLKASASNDTTTLNTAIGFDTLGVSTALPSTVAAGASASFTLTHFWRDSAVTFTYGSCTGGTLTANASTKVVTGGYPTSAGSCPISAVETLAGVAGSPKTTLLGTVTVTAASAVPSAPSISVTTGDSQNSVTFTDSAATPAITSHKIYRGATGAEALLATITSASPYVNSGLTNGTAYCYVVTSVNSVGESASSNEQCGTPVAASSSSLPTPTLVQDFESTSGITIAGTTVTGVLDTTNFVHGSNGLNLTQGTPSNSTIGATFSIGTRTPQSLGTMVVWIDQRTSGNVSSFGITPTAGANSCVMSSNTTGLGGMWVVANPSNPANTSCSTLMGSTASAAMTAKVSIFQASPYGAAGTIDALYVNAAGRPTVVPIFDDATIETYTNVRPLMNSLGLHYTVVIPLTYVGGTNRMTWAQITTIYNEGNDVACNTTNDQPMTNTTYFPTVQSVVDDLNNCRTTLVGKGLTRGASQVDLSNGATSDAISTALINAGFQTLRGTNPGNMFTRFGVPLGLAKNMPSTGFSSTLTDDTTCEAVINNAEADGTTGFYTFHDVSSAPTSVGYKLANFTACMNRAANDNHAGSLDVIGWQTWYNRDSVATAP